MSGAYLIQTCDENNYPVVIDAETDIHNALRVSRNSSVVGNVSLAKNSSVSLIGNDGVAFGLKHIDRIVTVDK